MKILAIETSCDETAVAVLEITGPVGKPDIKVLGNALYSQARLHEEYGGVYPNLAKREHIKNLPLLLEKALAEAVTNDPQLTTDNLDYIAVTQGPGLEPALWAGITFAEELGRKWSKPVVPVDHMEGHIYSVLYRSESSTKSQTPITKLELPALALLVSGGHTELVLVRDFGKYEILGRTRDDAVGEAFDKVARMLGLPYPGGPQISRLAELARGRGPEATFQFPISMTNSHDLDLSYSGLKTAVLYKLRSLEVESQEVKEEIARAFENSAIAQLINKTRKALELHAHSIKTLIVAGGVAGNAHLQAELGRLMVNFPDIALRLPERELITDNAIMIGIASYIRTQLNPGLLNDDTKIEALGNQTLSS